MKINSPSPIGLPPEQRKILDYVRQRMQGGLTLGDNQYCALLDFDFARGLQLTHGVESVFKNPLRSVPIGFEPIYAEDSSGNAIEVPKCKLNKRPLGGDGFVRDGFLGLTPSFQRTINGAIGEYVSSFLSSASPAALATTMLKTVTSTSLTAGDWDVTGIVILQGAPTGFTVGVASISAGSLTQGSVGDACVDSPTTPSAAADSSLVIPSLHLSLGSTQTVFLGGRANFTGGTCSASGRLSARRMTETYSNSAPTGRLIGILWGA